MSARIRATLSITGAILLVTASALWVFRNVLWAAADVYPWSSDTWGHLFKALYLYRQVGQGQWYPDLLPAWYMGLEMLRYHAPLAYYLLASLYAGLGNIFVAGNLFLFLTAWFGAVTVLLFRRWIGLWPAVVGGVLYTWLPDDLRVAFAEGNLPRALAACFFPLALYCLSYLLLERSRETDDMPLPAIIGLAATVALITLSHAMMGAIFAVCLTLIVLLAASIRRVRMQQFRAALFGIFGGLALSAWWLLPSFTGGITEINTGALSDAAARFAPTVSLNPIIRLGNQEAFYLSVALFGAALISLLHWQRLHLLARVLLVTGLIAEAVTFDVVYGLYTALPLHQYLWPIRFTSFSGPALLLGVVAALPAWRWRWLAALALVVIALDLYPSLALARTSPTPSALVQLAEGMRGTAGWRVAVADLSRLGSAPSFLLSETAGREQVYGWAYQGARTARLLAALNEALERGFTGYAIDRLALLGVDDVVTVPGVGVAPEFEAALGTAGFAQPKQFDGMRLYQRPGVPRATRVDEAILGIGAGAYDAALIFPSVLTGGSPYVDDYAPDELAGYPVVYLSHFDWHDQARAEETLRRYAAAGGRVVIDLNGMPPDPFARVPKFLSTYGEPVVLRSAVTLVGSSGTHRLMPFDPSLFPWHAYAPQGDVVASLTFDYLGERANGLAYRDEGSGRIWFLGMNLVYHAFLTRDPEAIRILEGVLGRRPDDLPSRTPVALEAYHADVTGYQFDYNLEHAGLVVVPVAQHDGTRAFIDGKAVTTQAVDTLVSFRAPAGPHHVDLIIQPTPIYVVGAGISIATAILILLLWLGWRLRARSGLGIPEPARRPIAWVGMALALWLSVTSTAYAAAIAIDGNFGDWAGQVNVPDPRGDSSDPDADLSALYYATNPGVSTMFWMIERYPPNTTSAPVTYLIRVDADNNGSYEQTVIVTYQALPNSAVVTVDHGGTGAGETGGAGGRRVEVGVPFSALGITPGSVIRFYVESQTSNQIRDGTASVQISAVSVLELPTLAIVTAGAIIAIWWFVGRKKWTT